MLTVLTVLFPFLSRAKTFISVLEAVAMLPVIVLFALSYFKPAGRFFTSTLLSSTPTPESDTFKFKVICFPA